MPAFWLRITFSFGRRSSRDTNERFCRNPNLFVLSLMTPIILWSVAVFAVACVPIRHGQGNTATLTSVMTPTPTPDREQINAAEADSTYKPNLQPRPERANAVYKESIKAWGTLRRATGLKDLERTKLAPAEIEVRIWQVPDVITPRTQCWHFSRKAGLWNASAFVDREFSGRMVRIPLDEPSAGWANWEAYAEQNLSPQSVHEAAKFITPATDEGTTMVEVRFGNEYERQFMANDEFLGPLFRTIKSEFFNNDDSKWVEF